MTGLEPLHNKHDLTPERVETLRSLLDDAARKVGQQRQTINELREALRGLLSQTLSNQAPNGLKAVQVARAAIAKATGEIT
jgi:hypothetical protein